MLNKEVLILPVEDRETETAEIGVVKGHAHTKTTIDGKTEETCYYVVNDTMVDEARVKEVGDTLTIDDVTYTIVNISTDDNIIQLKNDYNSEPYTFEPIDIYYCDDCKCLHFADAPMVDVDEAYEDNDFEIGHFAGYMSAVHDFKEWINHSGSLVDKALKIVGHDCFTEMVEDADALMKFYYVMDSLKAERENEPIPQYTHEELVNLIGHEFSEA